MPLDASGIFFFMPVFSFLFVFFIVYAVLAKTKVLGASGLVNLIVSFIMSTIFMSFSSLDLYVQTIVPWFVVLVICVFFVLLVYGFSAGKLSAIQTNWFGIIMIILLLIIFLVAAIKVFNPVFHPDLVISSGEGTSMMEQIRTGMEGRIAGTILLIIAVVAVSFVLIKS